MMIRRIHPLLAFLIALFGTQAVKVEMMHARIPNTGFETYPVFDDGNSHDLNEAMQLVGSLTYDPRVRACCQAAPLTLKGLLRGPDVTLDPLLGPTFQIEAIDDS